ncbi:MAG: sigma-70 family RNA polymerase sigma factor [Planctomycetes bacterium]|nr:sigma-70 family RNA polymerase sigma factor [Planctomycetota bacterium]
MATTTYLAAEAIGDPTERHLRAALFERILERVHRYFTRVVWDKTAVDDCVQQTLLALERSLQEGTYDPTQSFNRWMWLKAHSVYVAHCRSRARAPASLPADPALAAAPPEASVEAKHDAEVLLRLLREELEPETFEMFVLFFGEGYNVSEVAGITGRDRKTVRKRIQSAKRRALEVLEGETP